MVYLDISAFQPSSPSGLASLFAVVFLVWYISTAFLAWYRLRHVPGPFLASFSYLWIAKASLLGRQAPEHEALKKYGSLVRTSPNHLVTDDPAILRRVNGARSTYPRDRWFTATRIDENDHMASTVDVVAHDTVKAKLLHGYNGRDNVNIEAAVDLQVSHFVYVIRDRYLSTEKSGLKPLDFGLVARYFALDVVSRLAYGKAFGFLDAEGDLYNYTITTDRFLVALTLASDLPILRWITHSPLMKGLLPKPTDEVGLGKVYGIAQRIIKERYEREEFDDPDMVGAFMRHGVTEAEAVSESALIIVAGSDTTATVIRTTMLYIMSSPMVYHCLKSEISEAVKEQNVSCPITVEQSKKLPYLQAVIYEGFRMRPPVIYGHYKIVPPEGDTLDGVFIPGGTAIGHNAMAMMRNEKIFGADAELFRPERFVECSEEKRADMERTVEMVFGLGRWMCAGKMVAQAELNKIFFELMRTFDFQLVYPAKAMDEQSYMVFSQSNMWVKITEAT